MELGVHLRYIEEKGLFLVQFNPDAVKAGTTSSRIYVLTNSFKDGGLIGCV